MSKNESGADHSAPHAAKQVFTEALALHGEQRERFLQQACGEDHALRAEVEELLNLHDAGGPFLKSPTDPNLRAALAGPAAPGAEPTTELNSNDMAPGEADRLVGTRIASYKLLELLGEGGFGAVYVAEQERPVRRRVALKLIKVGMDTRRVVARFEAERQALAMMDHPNIARVLDAGASETGHPWFAMELVRGLPVTTFCDQAQLSAARRLELFVPVCLAVQHAHQKGIIHRDIKPSNVLVTLHDGKPVPKVIDFGIAKAVGVQLTDMTVYTQHRQMIGTPAYMSPEQAEMSGLDVDTRADVYSLGVLLYELLTGSPPFRPEDLLRAGWAEMQRIIREVEPVKPSTRVNTLGDTLPSVAARRQVEPRKLGVLLRGDLDWIAMKCLEKDRTRRYSTANDLAADVQRHLEGEPVLAAPPSLAYRMRKFVRRYRGQVATASAVALTLLLGILATTWQWRTALVERNRADAKAEDAEWGLYATNLAAAQLAMQAARWPEARERLVQCPESKRGWEWNFLMRKAESVQIELPGETIAGFSKDGAVLTFSGYSARLCDAVTGKTIGAPIDSDSYLKFATLSPDEQLVLTVGQDQGESYRARIWDATTGEQVGEPIDCRKYESAAFSPDSRTVVTLYGPQARLWDAATGKPIGGPMEHSSPLPPSFSFDSRMLLTASVVGAQLWDVATGEPIGEPFAQESGAELAIFSPDGQTILTASGAVAQMWDVATREPSGEPMTHDANLAFAAFSPDGRRVVTVADAARLWSAATARSIGERIPCDVMPQLNPFQKGQVPVFSADSQRLLTTFRNRTALWSAETGEPIGERLGADTGAWAAAFSRDSSTVLTMTGFGTACLWNGANGKLIARTDIRDLNDWYQAAVEFSPDGKLVALSTITSEDARVIPISGFESPSSSVDQNVPLELEALLGRPMRDPLDVLSIDGCRRITVQSDNTVRFIDETSGRELATISLASAAKGLDMTADGGCLVLSMPDGRALIWDVRDPAARQAERDARFAERKAARPDVDRLLAGPLPLDRLEDSIRNDAQRSPLRRLAMLDLLRPRVWAINEEASRVFERLTEEWITPARVLAAVREFSPGPNLPDGLRVKAAVEERAGKWAPGPDELSALAWSAVDKPGSSPDRVEGALQLARDGLVQKPDDADMLTLLGAALYRQGRPEEALEPLNKSVPLLPSLTSAKLGGKTIEYRLSRAWSFVILCQLALGRADEAQVSFDALKSSLTPGGFSLVGKVSGRKLTFAATDYYHAWEGWIELAPSGARFAGQCQEKDRRPQAFNGRRLAGPSTGFDGLWATSWEPFFGILWIFTEDEVVHGFYRFDDYVVEALTAMLYPPASVQPTSTTQPAAPMTTPTPHPAGPPD